MRMLELARRHLNVVMFATGFLFDLATLRRIDAFVDLGLQLTYLTALTILLVYQHREARGQWKPPARIERPWAHNVEVLHFFYGALLSAYVVLYLKSSTRARPLVFFLLLVALMVLNEMPQIRRAGYRLRLGLYAFCVISFLNYFVPILVGRMSGWVFLIALFASAGVVWLVADRLAARETAERKAIRARLFAPALVVCVLIGWLYVFRLIPPVPLSVQFQGIYHDVEREDGSFVLTYEKPPLHLFWRNESRPFRRREGDRLHYFVRVFAPTRFQHEVYARWEHEGKDGWRTRDRIRLPVVGGRAQGFRAYAVKSNFEPGRWRVIAETEDGRAMASLVFTVKEDASTTERTWRTIGG